MILVTVGVNIWPFERLVRAMDALAPTLDEEVVIQAGSSRTPVVNARGLVFTSDAEMERLIGGARVVVAHAGIGTLISCFRAGVPLIVVPRRKALGEHIDDHQRELAGALAGDRRLTIIEDVEALAEALRNPPSAPALTDGEAPLVRALRDDLRRLAGL